MEREAQRRRAEALDRFWDAMADDGAAERPEDVDEVFAATIYRLAEMGDLPGLAVARARVWSNLSRRGTSHHLGASLPFPARAPADERPMDGQKTRTDGRRTRGASWRAVPGGVPRTLAHAATILLLIGTLALLYVATRGMRPDRPVVIVPAIDVPTPMPGATPSATPLAGSDPAQFLWRYQDPESEPFAISPQIAIDPDGNLWIVDGARMGFQIVSPEGQLREHWGTPGKGDGEFDFIIDAKNSLDAFSGIAFTPDGGFYVADSHNFRVQQFDRDRRFVRAWGDFGTGDGQFVRPIDVEVDAEGNVYVIDGARNDIQKFDAEGRFLLRFGGRGAADGQVNGVSWGTLDAAGNLWLADSGNDRIQQFASDGAFLRALGAPGSGEGQFRDPQDVAIDAAGRIVVADTGNHRIQIFTSDGQFLAAIAGDEAGGTTFVDPTGVAVDARGNLYVHDYGNREFVEKFRLAPFPGSAAPAVAPP